MKNKIWKCRCFKRLSILAMCFVMMVSTLTIHVGAAQGVTAITALLCPHFTIIVDGAEQTFFNVQGQEVHPILYNGTTYLPVRAIGELMNKNVNWDQSTLTATLSGVRTSPRVTGTPDSSAVQKNIYAEIRPDFTIVVDDTVRTFTDVNGNVVYPVLYNGSTYLPLRAIGGLMGCTVDWNGDTHTATLTSISTGDSLVTDADTFDPAQPGQTTQPPTSTTALTAEQAKQKALAHAGLIESQAVFEKCKLEREHDRMVYELEFTIVGGEYEYEIDASTGAVLSFEYDAQGKTPASSEVKITADKAQALALAKVPGASSADVVHVRLLSEHGWYQYKVKIVANGMEYEFTIDAYSGAFHSWKGELIGW